MQPRGGSRVVSSLSSAQPTAGTATITKGQRQPYAGPAKAIYPRMSIYSSSCLYMCLRNQLDVSLNSEWHIRLSYVAARAR